MRHDVKLKLIQGSIRRFKLIDCAWSEDVHGVLGISEVDWAIFTQHNAWSARERNSAATVLQQALHGAVQHAELPQMVLPAEFVAAVIGVLVHPTNWESACHLGQQTYDGEKMLNDDGDEIDAMEYVTPRRLFLDVIFLSDNFDGYSVRDVERPTKRSKSK